MVMNIASHLPFAASLRLTLYYPPENCERTQAKYRKDDIEFLDSARLTAVLAQKMHANQIPIDLFRLQKQAQRRIATFHPQTGAKIGDYSSFKPNCFEMKVEVPDDNAQAARQTLDEIYIWLTQTLKTLKSDGKVRLPDTLAEKKLTKKGRTLGYLLEYRPPLKSKVRKPAA